MLAIIVIGFIIIFGLAVYDEMWHEEQQRKALRRSKESADRRDGNS